MSKPKRLMSRKNPTGPEIETTPKAHDARRTRLTRCSSAVASYFTSPKRFSRDLRPCDAPMGSKNQGSDSAGAIIPPPLIVFGALLLGLVLNAFVSFPLVPFGLPFTLIPSIPIVVIGFFIDSSALRALKRANTSLDPADPTTSLVTEGAFGYTRNPIYLSFVLIYLGAAVAFNSLWALVLLVAVFLFFERGQIPREERYLERTFGDEYRRYKARVRRWI